MFQNKPVWFQLEKVGHFVTAEGLLMVIGATLFIANNKVGGFLVAGAVLLQALTVDNYLL